MGEMNDRAETVKGLVSDRLNRLKFNPKESAVRAELAKMRRGIGKPPGEIPELWGMMFEDMPEEMAKRIAKKQGIISCEEWAVHTALTMYALHQQGKDIGTENMNKPGQSLGTAVAMLITRDEDREEAVRRRFNTMATSADINELAWHLKGIIQLLRRDGIELDYPKLAEELYRYQFYERMTSVRLQWGRDFYSHSNKHSNDKEGEMSDD